MLPSFGVLRISPGPAFDISRRQLLCGAAGVVLGRTLRLPSEPVADAFGGQRVYVDHFRRAGDSGWARPIARAIAAAQRSGGGRVLGSPGRVYGLRPHAIYTAQLPHGATTSYRVCVQIPPGVTLDMQGSTLRLLGSTAAAIVTNKNLSGVGWRDTDVALVNAVLDGGSIPARGTPLLHLAYVDRLILQDVKLVNGNCVGGWVYNCNASTFDSLEVDGFRGLPWSIGSAARTGNQVYDSTFGALRARNVTWIDPYYYFPGNSFVLTLTRCQVKSIEAYRCTAGIKIQSPTQDLTIGTVTTSACGSPTGNSGLKLQGDKGGRPVANVSVGMLRAEAQTGPGLYMERTLDCTVDSYRGVSNNVNAAQADVWIGGTNDLLMDVQSDESGGPGVLVRPYATGYRLDNVLVRNPYQSPKAVRPSVGVAVEGGVGSFGHVTCVDTRRRPTMERGVDVSSPEAIGLITALEVEGNVPMPFASVSKEFEKPVVH